MLVLPHDVFFGDLQLSRVLDGITVSHRIANSPPAQLPVHTHSDAHFVLITSGGYVSSATGDAHPHATFIYNLPVQSTAIISGKEREASSAFHCPARSWLKLTMPRCNPWRCI